MHHGSKCASRSRRATLNISFPMFPPFADAGHCRCLIRSILCLSSHSLHIHNSLGSYGFSVGMSFPQNLHICTFRSFNDLFVKNPTNKQTYQTNKDNAQANRNIGRHGGNDRLKISHHRHRPSVLASCSCCNTGSASEMLFYPTNVFRMTGKTYGKVAAFPSFLPLLAFHLLQGIFVLLFSSRTDNSLLR